MLESQGFEDGFRALVEQIPAVTYVISDDDPQLPRYVSPQFELVFGYPRERWLEDPRFWGSQLVHPDDRELVHAAARGSGETGVYHAEYRVVTAEGRVLWLRDDAVRVDGADGRRYWRGAAIDVTASKRVEQGLRASEEKYRALVEHLPAVIYVDVHEPSARSVYISPNAEEVLGRTPSWFAEHPGCWPELVVHGDDIGRVMPAWEAARDASTTFVAEYRWLRPDGSSVWVRDTAIPIFDDAGARPLFWQGVMVDVTDRKVAEEAARRSEERYHALVEGIPAVIYETGPDDERRTLYVSRHVEEVLGYSREEWLEQPDIWMELLHPDDREIELAANDEHNETGEPWSRDYRLIAADGRFVWVHDQATLLRDEAGAPRVWQGVMLDVTEQKQLEQELRRANDELEFRVLARTAELAETNEMMSLEIGERKHVESRLRQAEERYRLLVENLPAVVYLWEVDPGVDGEPSREYTSPQIEQVLGFTASEWNQEPLWRGRVHPHDRERVFAAARRSEATGEPFEEEYRYLARDGGIVWVFDQARLITRDRRGQPKLFQGVFVDVTARKLAEAQAAAAETRYRLLAEMGSVIAYTMDRSEEGAPHRITSMSPQVERLVGYTAREWIEDPTLFPRILHPDDEHRVREISRSIDVTGEPWSVEYRLLARDDRVVWVHDEGIVATRDERGRPVEFHGVLLDITERREMEERLRETEERYRSLVEGMPAIPWTELVDADGRSQMIYVGPQVTEVLGYTPEELLGEVDHFRRLVHPDDLERALAVAATCDETGEPWDLVYRSIARDGSVVWLHSVGVVTSREGGRTVWQGVALDVTSRFADESAPSPEPEAASETEAVPEPKP